MSTTKHAPKMFLWNHTIPTHPFWCFITTKMQTLSFVWKSKTFSANINKYKLFITKGTSVEVPFCYAILLLSLIKARVICVKVLIVQVILNDTKCVTEITDSKRWRKVLIHKNFWTFCFISLKNGQSIILSFYSHHLAK